MENMADEDAKWYNALALLYEGNFGHLRKLREQYASYRELWERVRPAARHDPDRAWAELQTARVTLCLANAEHFPALLREIPAPPLGLYTRGVPLANGEARVAIVGTRKATREGLALARRFARELAEQGIAVVSGLALGIDAASHTGALEGKGRTIAVLATGLDRVYPRENEQLAHDILGQGGTLVSEYPLNSPSYPDRFIERNRIVSGLSLGVVVIEAPEASGALATARFAGEQGRDVLVAPGPVAHPNYAGSHALIRDGAVLVRSVADIIEELRLGDAVQEKAAEKAEQQLADLDGTEKMVITVLQTAGGPMAVDAIAEACAQPVPAVNSAIAMLVVKGMVREHGGKYSI